MYSWGLKTIVENLSIEVFKTIVGNIIEKFLKNYFNYSIVNKNP